MYADLIWDLKMNVFLRQSIWSTNKILKEIAVLECEKFSKLARIFNRFFLMLVFCQYNVVYSAKP